MWGRTTSLWARCSAISSRQIRGKLWELLLSIGVGVKVVCSAVPFYSPSHRGQHLFIGSTSILCGHCACPQVVTVHCGGPFQECCYTLIVAACMHQLYTVCVFVDTCMDMVCMLSVQVLMVMVWPCVQPMQQFGYRVSHPGVGTGCVPLMRAEKPETSTFSPMPGTPKSRLDWSLCNWKQARSLQ